MPKDQVAGSRDTRNRPGAPEVNGGFTAGISCPKQNIASVETQAANTVFVQGSQAGERGSGVIDLLDRTTRQRHQIDAREVLCYGIVRRKSNY